MARAISWLARPGMLRALVGQARLAVRLLREPRVPLWLKALPVAGFAYVIWPLDVIPDVFPVVGELDDLALILLALKAFLSLCPPSAVAFHRAAIDRGHRYSPIPASETVLDAEWHVSS